jgi:hypothetical protein
MKRIIILITSIVLANVSWLHGLDNPHFYRATNMFLEPFIEHDYLSTVNTSLSGGSTSKGRSACNTIVPLFDIYGVQTVQNLNANTPYTDPTDFYDNLLNQLRQLPTRPGFATVSIDGKFKILEANLSFTQNLRHGLFLFFHLPIRKLTINNITITDLSPDDSITPNKNSPAWQAVFQNLKPLLAHYGLNANATTSVGPGDLSSWLGWTHNYQDTRTLDFIDITLMTGFLSPTGKKYNPNKLFSLPTGYNGHWGFPLCTMASIGFFEWITVGGYLNSLFFLNNTQPLRLKTDVAQNGIIKLAHDCVTVHKGPLLHTGLYLKADHFAYGFSLAAAYSYASQHKDQIKPHNSPLFDCAIANSDTTLAGWNMHTMNFSLEYDFTRETSKVGNRIGLFYNLEIAGKRTFNTNITGGMYGFDISWHI